MNVLVYRYILAILSNMDCLLLNFLTLLHQQQQCFLFSAFACFFFFDIMTIRLIAKCVRGPCKIFPSYLNLILQYHSSNMQNQALRVCFLLQVTQKPEVAEMIDSHAAIQKKLNRMEKWSGNSQRSTKGIVKSCIWGGT